MSLQFLKDSLTNKNVQAFLQMIRHSEGTAAPDGYNYIFGSSPKNTLRFTDFSHHPDMHQPFRGGFSSAAGAYQFLYDTWEAIQKKYNLPDFSPANQDIACVELISQKNVLQKLMNGDFYTALKACSNIWASLPGNSYNQPIHAQQKYPDWYVQNGGTIASDNNV